MNLHNIVIGREYEWLMPNNPVTGKRFFYLRPTRVLVVAKTDSRAKVRFVFDGKSYERSISTVNLLHLKESQQ